MKDKISAYRQSQWNLNKAKENYFYFQFIPELTATAYLILLLANISETKSFEEISQKKALPNGFVPLNNSNYSENDATCPAPEKPVVGGSFQKKNVFVAPSVVPVPTNRKPKKTPSKYYAQYFRPAPVDEIPVEIEVEASILDLTSEKIHLAKKLQERIKHLLPKLSMNPEVLDEFKQTTLKVVVASRSFLLENANVPKDSIKQGSSINGMYSPRRNIIFISNELVYMEDWALERTLLNEFHHAAITRKNFLLLEKNIEWDLNENALLMSFLNTDIDIDFVKRQRFERATEEFKNNIKKFIEIYDKQELKKSVTSAETSFFDKTAYLVKKYYPATPHLPITIPTNFYNEARKHRDIPFANEDAKFFEKVSAIN